MELNYEDSIYSDSMCPSAGSLSDYQNDLPDDDNSDEEHDVATSTSALISPLKKQPVQYEEFFKQTYLTGLKPVYGYGEGSVLRRKLIELLANFPHGICSDKLIANFFEKFGYLPEFANYGNPTFLDYISSNPQLWDVETSPFTQNEVILYSKGNMGNVVNKVKEVWINILQLLVENGYILNLEEIPQLLSSKMGEPVNPEDWVHTNSHQVYIFCFSKVQKGQGTRHEWSKLPGTAKASRSASKIFIHVTKEREELLVQPNRASKRACVYYELRRNELQKLQGPRRKKDATIYNQHEAEDDKDLDDDTLTMADFLEENCYYLCLGASITNPGHFYVNLCQTWNYLEELMEKMQNFYSLNGSRDDFEATAEYLIPGAVVAIKCLKEREWHRGKIVEIDNSGVELIYSVKLLDYGEVEKVSAKAIRHLVMPHWIDLIPQRILCRAQIGGFYNLNVGGVIQGLPKESWTFDAAHAFKQETFDQPMMIHVKKKIQIEDETAWEVFVHLYDLQKQKITKFHLERHILKNSRGICFQLNTDETDKDAQPPKALVKQIKPAFQNKKS